MATMTIGGIIINPAGVEVVIDITLGGSNPTAYTAQGGDTAHSFPVTASARTQFHFLERGDYVVSVKRNGAEIADGAGATKTCRVGHGQVTEYTVGVDVGTEAVAQEATLVHLAGTETITGNKTYSGNNTHGQITMTDAKNIILNATTGTKIGTATTQKLGFWGVTPAVQPSAYTQTYSTANKTVDNPTAASPATTAATVTDNSGGSSGGTTIAAIAGAVDPTAALKTDTANAIATLAAMVNKLTADNVAMKAELVKLIADDLDNRQSITAIIDDGQAVGILS